MIYRTLSLIHPDPPPHAYTSSGMLKSRMSRTVGFLMTPFSHFLLIDISSLHTKRNIFLELRSPFWGICTGDLVQRFSFSFDAIRTPSLLLTTQSILLRTTIGRSVRAVTYGIHMRSGSLTGCRMIECQRGIYVPNSICTRLEMGIIRRRRVVHCGSSSH